MNRNHNWAVIRCFSCFVVGLLLGCDLRRMGSPLPEVFAREYLEKQGYEKSILNDVLEYGPIDRDVFARLSRVSDVSVRHMLARNSHLSPDERAILSDDGVDYVRAGAAMNPGITRDEVIKLVEEPYGPVLHGLAMNPFVPEDILLTLRRKSSGLLGSFAKNVNCPDVIVQEIERSGSSTQKKMLSWTQARRTDANYRYLGCRLLPEALGSPINE